MDNKGNTIVCGSCMDSARELYKLWEAEEEEITEIAIQDGDILDNHSCEDGYDIRRNCDCACINYWED